MAARKHPVKAGHPVKPPDAPAPPVGRPLICPVVFRDANGQMVTYDVGDIPAPEHMPGLGGHLFAPVGE